MSTVCVWVFSPLLALSFTSWSHRKPSSDFLIASCWPYSSYGPVIGHIHRDSWLGKLRLCMFVSHVFSRDHLWRGTLKTDSEYVKQIRHIQPLALVHCEVTRKVGLCLTNVRILVGCLSWRDHSLMWMTAKIEPKLSASNLSCAV